MQQQRIMITGAGGFLGSHICRYFGKQGHSIAAVGRFSTSSNIAHSYPNLCKLGGMTLPDTRFITLVREFKPDTLIHCAGTSSVPFSVKEPFIDFQSTVDVCGFTLETLRKESPHCKFVLLSSASVYGNPQSLPVSENDLCRPVSPYGFHKRMCEMLVEEYSSLHNVSAVILRIFSAFGEGLYRQVVHDLCKKFTDGEKEIVEVYGSGEESRDFIHALDIARAIETVMIENAEGYYNLASGEQTTIATLVGLIKEALGSTKPIHFTGQIREGDPLYWQADIKRLTSLGFSPQIYLDEGIKNYCSWFKTINERGLK